MSQVMRNENLVNLTQTSISSSAVLKLTEADSIAYQLHYTDATPVHKGFVAANVNVTDNTITITSHGFNTGLKAALTGTNLPGGLSATSYWIIVVDANTIKLATSLANAVNGSAVDILTQGTTADADLAPISLATTGFVVKLQQSNDNSTFFDVSGLTVTITASGDTLWLVSNPPCLYHKVVITPTTGALSIFVLPCVRNNSVLSPGI